MLTNEKEVMVPVFWPDGVRDSMLGAGHVIAMIRHGRTHRQGHKGERVFVGTVSNVFQNSRQFEFGVRFSVERRPAAC